jgi:hypothetical protein
MMTISYAIQAGATLTIYPEILIFGRFIGACFAPINDAVMLLYCQETSTPEVRGVLSSLFTTGYAVMALFGTIVGMKSVLGRSLTILLAVPIPLGIIGCIFLFYLRETPKFLMIAKYVDSLCTINNCLFREDRENAMKSLVYYQGDKPENEDILNNYCLECKEQQQKGSLLELFTIPYLRKAVILGNCGNMLCLPLFALLLTSTYFLEEVQFSE